MVVHLNSAGTGVTSDTKYILIDVSITLPEKDGQALYYQLSTAKFASMNITTSDIPYNFSYNCCRYSPRILRHITTVIYPLLLIAVRRRRRRRPSLHLAGVRLRRVKHRSVTCDSCSPILCAAAVAVTASLPCRNSHGK